jgi:hypothetical protein
MASRLSPHAWLLPTLPLVLLGLWSTMQPAAGISEAPIGAGTTTATTPGTASTLTAAGDLPTCDAPSGTTGATAGERPEVRQSAQHGLDFLAADTVRWQADHQCYGCHVQAVTLKAMAVGKHHQYNVSQDALDEVIRGMLELPGGSRTTPGLGLHHGTGVYLSAARTLGGAAMARYDAWVGPKLADDLLLNAQLLLDMQTTDGSIANDYTHAPVAVGPVQDTVLAMATWSQAHARTADDRWLTAIASAERWLHQRVAAWGTGGATDLQELNYVLLGLHEAGTGADEPIVATALQGLLRRQHASGGWSLAGDAPDPYATGQALYTLRTFGLADTDPAVKRGTDWLIAHQQDNGGWSSGGSARAEAMWGVLGLVSVDVLSVAVTGVEAGQHADGVLSLHADAIDNQGTGVTSVELRVDDLPQARACAASLDAVIDTSKLSPGEHHIDMIAVNAEGQTARRRIEVFTGPVYLTRLGSRWSDGGTEISLRDIAPASLAHHIELAIHHATAEGQPGAIVVQRRQPGAEGPISFHWDGTPDSVGSPAPDGRYLARVSLVDAAGAVVHQVDHVFVHDTTENQQENWAQVAGRLSFADGAGASGALVELVDKLGNIVAVTRSTGEGQYRFKNVNEGDYELRVKKEGYADQAAPVAAEVGAEAKVDAQVQ